MKHLFYSLIAVLFYFHSPVQNGLSAANKVDENPNSAMAPCTYLYVENNSTNSDDLLSVKITNTGYTADYSLLGVSGYVGPLLYCGSTDFEVTTSVGGINAAVGIKTASGTVLACQTVCCADGIKVYLNGINIQPGTTYTIFLYNGSC